MRTLSCLLVLLVLAACGAGTAPSTSTAPSTGAAAPSAAPAIESVAPSAASAEPSSGVLIDLAAVDVCSLIDEATVQAITGQDVKFIDDGSNQASLTKCFWGAAAPGVPAYLEVSVSRTNDGLASWEPGLPGCSVTPVTGVGVEAKGATCPGDIPKSYLAVTDQGLVVEVLVNDPPASLQPADLAETFEAVWLGLQ